MLYTTSNKVVVLYRVVCWLIGHEATVQTPDQTSKQNMKNISSLIFLQLISNKNYENKYKIAMKKFLKKL